MGEPCGRMKVFAVVALVVLNAYSCKSVSTDDFIVPLKPPEYELAVPEDSFPEEVGTQCPKGDLAYKPKPPRKCKKRCPDFGQKGGKAPILQNLYSHLEVAWEANCVGSLINCAYHAAGSNRLDQGTFTFLPQTIAGSFQGAEGGPDEQVLHSFKKQLQDALFQQYHTYRFGRNQKPSCTRHHLDNFQQNRAKYMKELQSAWLNHFKAYHITPTDVWNNQFKKKADKFDAIIQAVCDKIANDSGKHMNEVMKWMQQVK